jgi:hypothetical protein
MRKFVGNLRWDFLMITPLIAILISCLPSSMSEPRTTSSILSSTPKPIVPPAETIPGLGLPTPLLTIPTSASPVTALPVTKPIEATLTPTTTRALTLTAQFATWLTLDDQYVYWTVLEDPRHIFRYPLIGGLVQTVATSRFADGDLGVHHPLRSGNWLIFLDTRLRNNSVWLVRAINLTDHSEQTILDGPGDPVSWPGPTFDAYGDQVVWARTGHSIPKNCDESILGVYDLRSGAQHELEHLCAEHEHLWIFPHMAANQIVVERDLPDEKGKGNDIYLIDLPSGHFEALTSNQASSMPTISGAWIVWKDLGRFQWDDADVIYNHQTGTRQVIYAPGGSTAYHAQDGRWLYWLPGAEFYIYDLESNRMFTIVSSTPDARVCAGTIHNNIAAWCVDTQASLALPKNTVLEWRSLP